MPNYTEDELKNKVKEIFTNRDIATDDPQSSMITELCARFLYLSQVTSANILMENSFTRSVKLSSKITHAADNFYSVDRGNCRRIRFKSVRPMKDISLSKFDLFTEYKSYKFIAATDYDLSKGQVVTLDFYLTDDRYEIITQGNDQLYLDIDIEDLSNDISIFDGDTGDEYILGSNIYDLYQSAESGRKIDIAVVTQEGYRVRLWKTTPFLSSSKYKIVVLKTPTKGKEQINLNEVTKIQDLIIDSMSIILEVNEETYKDDNQSHIYLQTANFVKYNDLTRSNSSLADLVEECFSEIKGYSIDVTEDTITIYYVVDYDTSTPHSLNPVHVQAFEKKAKAYFIDQEFVYTEATVQDVSDLTITIKYTGDFHFEVSDEIIRSMQNQIGGEIDWFRLINKLNTNLILLPNIVQVSMSDMPDITLTAGKRINYVNLTIDYVGV